jgi:endonuclease/exonuclease/phosphatase family metal-dependent hydrolase
VLLTTRPYLLPEHNTDIILAGDFNGVLSSSDVTGQRNYSRALEKFVTGLKLHDIGEQNPARTSFTHYTPRGASCLDRIYISNKPKQRKQGTLTAVAAFTDRMAFVLRMASSDPIPMRGRGHWRVNTSVSREESFRLLQQNWKIWRNHGKYYPTAVLWWERYVKRMLKQTFMWEGAARRRDRRDYENFYYEVIYALLQTPIEHAIKATKLKQLKAKITRLHHEEQRSRHLNNDERYRLEGENTTLYHILKSRKRQESKSVQIVYDEEGVPQTTKVGILKTFRNYMYKKSGNITIEYVSLRRLLDGRHNILPNEATEAIDAPIKMYELKRAAEKGKPNKEPGWNGISNDFFKIT